MRRHEDRGGNRSARADPGRAIGFSDAVIAIVITLLVIDLRPPQTEPGDLLGGLLDEWPTYLAYAASYVYLAVIWMNHKAAFARIREMDVGLQWANLGILATLALVPWPTAVIAERRGPETSPTNGWRSRSMRSSERCCASRGWCSSRTWPAIPTSPRRMSTIDTSLANGPAPRSESSSIWQLELPAYSSIRSLPP